MIDGDNLLRTSARNGVCIDLRALRELTPRICAYVQKRSVLEVPPIAIGPVTEAVFFESISVKRRPDAPPGTRGWGALRASGLAAVRSRQAELRNYGYEPKIHFSFDGNGYPDSWMIRSIENRFDRTDVLIVVSADADFWPVIGQAMNRGIKVFSAGFVPNTNKWYDQFTWHYIDLDKVLVAFTSLIAPRPHRYIGTTIISQTLVPQPA